MVDSSAEQDVPTLDDDEVMAKQLSELLRGNTPVDIEKRSLDLCQAYIGGSWCNAKDATTDITVTRITGGLTNQLYRVQLSDTIPRKKNLIYEKDEPTDVAIKLYMDKGRNILEDKDDRLSDTVFLTIMSQLDIGPKVYGIFGDGMIQHFHDHEQFCKKYQTNEPKLREMAHILARIHHLQIPINKKSDWVFSQIRKNLNEAFGKLQVQSLIDELNLEHIKTLDPNAEIKIMEKLVEQLKSPLVFCHNDFRGSNILVTKPEEKILLVDMEYSAYGYRAFDIANYMYEWGIEPLDLVNRGLPSDKALEHFIRLYVEGCDLVVPGYSLKPENSVQAIVKETKTMALVLDLYLLSLMMATSKSTFDSIPFDKNAIMIYSNECSKKYLDLKNRLIADGTI